MSRAFSNAWTILKQRGHAIMPNPEEEKAEQQRMQRMIDDRVDNSDDMSFSMDEYNQLNSPLTQPKDIDNRFDDFDIDEDQRRELLLDMLQQRGRDKSFAQHIDRAGQQMGPMADSQRQSEADQMEAEGIDIPMRPRGPPANIGQAGSSGAPPLTGNPFAAAMQRMKGNQKPSL